MNTALVSSTTGTPSGLSRGFLLAFLWIVCLVPLWWFYIEPRLKNVSSDVSGVQQQVAELEKATAELKTQKGHNLQPAEQKKIEDLIRAANIAQANLQQLEGSNAVSRSEIIRLSEQAARAGDTLKAARQHIAARAAKLKAVTTSDSGRKIVADKDRLRLLATVMASKPPDEATVVAWEQRLGILRDQIQKATSPKTPSDLGTEFGSAVTRLMEEIEQSTTRWQDDVLVIDRLTAESRAATPVSGTADEAINVYRQQQAAERIALMEQTLRKAQNDQAKSLADAEALRVEAEARVKQQELENETSRLKSREKELVLIGSTEAQQRAKKLAREKLEAEVTANAAEINQLLSPFFACHKVQRNDQGFTSGNARPLSLSLIKGQGALDTTDNGLEHLYLIGGQSSNNRLRGAFPSYYDYAFKQNASIREKVQRAQQMLIKYGDYLVEKGYLAP